jgi:transposase
VAQERLPVRKIREVLRLKAAGISDRKIAAAVGSARSTVQECIRRAREAGITWPLPESLDDSALEARLYALSEATVSVRPQPDFTAIHTELARPGVTRMLLWQEYKATHPEGWQYSVFCDQYRRWLTRQELVLRQNHSPGEKLFVDYAGQTVPVVDRYSGEMQPAQIFVAVLGCSNYTFACATRSQSLSDWLDAHVQALEFFGGVPAAIVIDNLKSGVKRGQLGPPGGCRESALYAYTLFSGHNSAPEPRGRHG